VDINMDSDATTLMDIPEAAAQAQNTQLTQPQQTTLQPQPVHPNAPGNTSQTNGPQFREREPIRDVAVKVHIRKPDKDSWIYLGRGVVTSELVGRSARIVVRALSSQKILTAFGETATQAAALQAEKRGNFVVVSCVEGNRVVSWSLNALNNAETLRLLAIIELSCYACKQVVNDPQIQSSHRRRIARAIKDDRRKRHKRRKDAESMVAAFAKTGLSDDTSPQAATAVEMQG